MRRRRAGEWLTVFWMLLPFAALAALGVWFFTHCTDGWCGGVLREAALVYAGLLGLVIVVYVMLRLRGLKPTRAGGGAWLVAVTGMALLYASSQFFEGDIVPGLIAVAAAAGAGYAFFLLTLANPLSKR